MGYLLHRGSGGSKISFFVLRNIWMTPKSIILTESQNELKMPLKFKKFNVYVEKLVLGTYELPLSYL